MKKWTDSQKLENSMRLQKELSHFYDLVAKLCIVCMRGGQRLIIENPYSKEHYLTRYFPLKPKIIDFDRRENGDYYKKPTQYFFINCEPKNNLVFEPISYNQIGVGDAIRKIKKEDCEKIGANNIKEARSMIHPDYAERFIKKYIL
jgi:hypothetical protein